MKFLSDDEHSPALSALNTQIAVSSILLLSPYRLERETQRDGEIKRQRDSEREMGGERERDGKR